MVIREGCVGFDTMLLLIEFAGDAGRQAVDMVTLESNFVDK